jgi:hypothetical protein
LFEINQPGIARTELGCDTPRPVDMNGVSCRFETLQIVEIETWQLQFLKPFSRIQPVKPGKNALMQIGVNFRRSSGPKEVCKGFVPE